MNILNIFNNLVTLSTLHSPTHSQTKQPQCSCKYNMYQHVAPTSQDNPPMSAASEESTADFLPKALQTGKKGDRAAETGRQKRAAETGGRTGAAGPGRQKRGGRNGRQDRGGRNGAAETGRQKRGGRKQMPENGLKAPAAGERHRKSRTRTPQSRKRTEITRNWTRKSENRQGKPGEQAGKARCRRGRHSESEVKRIGQGQKKGNSESRLIVRHPQFPHQPKTTNLNEP